MVKRFFGFLKKLFFRIFGKARWFLIIFVVTGILVMVPAFTPWMYPNHLGLRDENSFPVKEISLSEVDGFSVNDSGKAIISSAYGSQGLNAILDLDTGKESFSGIGLLVDKTNHNETFYSSNYAITDDNEIYALRDDMLMNRASLYTGDSIIRLSEDYKYLGEVCRFEYDPSERLRDSRVSRLHYYDGAVCFALLDKSGVKLYSIDTSTHITTVSDPYPTDPDGTYTVCVIPVDGAFLFLRSDGNVYLTGFNEPLVNIIYNFSVSAGEKTDNPYFTQAVVSGGDLYFAGSEDPSSVYMLKNGKAVKIIDLKDISGREDSKIMFLDSYKPEKGTSEQLVLCLEDGIFTFSNAGISEKVTTIHVDPSFIMYLYTFLTYVLNYDIYCIVIHLIVRKKTLLYKQLMLILPVFVILAITIAISVYAYSEEKMGERINNEITMICELASSEFDGFDFSNLMQTDEETGASYRSLNEKFQKLASNKLQNWSESYVFTVIYRKNINEAYVLAGDDKIYVPLYEKESANLSGMLPGSDDIYLDNNIFSMFAAESDDSKISAFSRINDRYGSGDYYFSVSTDRDIFYNQRRDILFKVFEYSFLIIGTIVVLIVVSVLYILRIIKKATKTVREISAGNLSARVNYRSKDELGQICAEVNEMGKSLETLFKEKDETESFYYKFVPEKFRELLGKEKFTDLSLGDAKSSELTVLFCDIRSFSVNSEMMTASENFAFVNVIYGKMGPIIRKNNGFVDKYIGDAVMALFEDAGDAVKCGIELYHAIVHDPATSAELKVSDINIGIGIHSGMAMVGIVGESERLAGTVISDTVNLSSRLESLTKQYKTAMLISKDTLDRMKEDEVPDLRYMGIVQVAGVNEVKAVYEVLDCLDEKERKVRSGNAEDLKEAIRLFHLGRRSEAVSALEKLASEGRNDHVTDMYMTYIREMSEEDKGNVFRFVRK